MAKGIILGNFSLGKEMAISIKECQILEIPV